MTLLRGELRFVYRVQQYASLQWADVLRSPARHVAPTIAEAATELFLERGFAETTIADITQRAGVSRSSFFNYFSSKSDVLWAALDDAIHSAVAALRAGAAPSAALRAAAVHIRRQPPRWPSSTAP
jgi:AcrR family transcriptional regulator